MNQEKENLVQKISRLEMEKNKLDLQVGDLLTNSKKPLNPSRPITQQKCEIKPITTEIDKSDVVNQLQNALKQISALTQENELLKSSSQPISAPSQRTDHRPIEDHNELKKKVSTLNTQLYKLENEKIALLKKFENQKEDLNLKLKDTQKELMNQKKFFDETIKSKNQDFEKVTKALNTEKNEILKKLDLKESELTKVEEKLKTLTHQNSVLDSAFKNLEIKKNQCEAEFKNNNTENEKIHLQLEKENISLKEELKNYVKLNKDLENVKEKLLEKNQKIEKSLTVDLTQLEKLENSKFDLEKCLNTANELNLEKENQIEDLKQKLTQKTDDLLANEDEKKKLNMKLVEIKDLTESYQKKNEVLLMDLDQTKGLLLDSEMTREELQFKSEKFEATFKEAQDRFELEKESLRKEIKAAEEENLSLLNLKNSLIEKEKLYVSESKELRLNLNESLDKRTQLETQILILQKRISQLELEIDGKDIEKNKILDEKENLKKHLDVKEAEANERISILQGAVKRHIDLIEEYKLQLEASKNMEMSMEKKIEEASQLQDDANTEIQGLRNKLQAKETFIAELLEKHKLKVVQDENEIITLQSMLTVSSSELAEALTINEMLKANAGGEKNKLAEILEKKELKINQMENSLSAMQTKLENTSNNFSESTLESNIIILKLQGEVASTTDKNEKLKCNLEKLQNTIFSLERSLAASSDQLSEALTDNKALVFKLELEKVRLNKIEADKNKLLQEVEDLKKEKLSTAVELTKYTAELVVREEEINNLKSSYDILKEAKESTVESKFSKDIDIVEYMKPVEEVKGDLSLIISAKDDIIATLEAKNLNEEISMLTDKLNLNATLYSELEGKLELAENNLKEGNLLIENLKSAASLNNQLVAALKNEIEEMNTTKKALIEEAITFNDTINSQVASMQDLESRIKILMTEKAILSTSEEKGRIYCSTLKTELEELCSLNETNNQKLSEKTTEIESLKIVIDGLNEKCNLLKEEEESNATTIAALEVKLKSVIACEEDKSNCLILLKEEALLKENQIEHLKEDISMAVAEHKNAALQIETINSGKVILENMLAEKEALIAEKNILIENITTQSNILKTETVNLKGALLNAEKEIKTLDCKLEHINNTLENETTSNLASQSKVESVEFEKDNMFRNLQSTNETLETLRIDNKRLEKEIAESENLVFEKNEEIKSLKFSCTEEKKNFDTLVSQLTVAKEELETELKSADKKYIEDTEGFKKAINLLNEDIKQEKYRTETLSLELTGAKNELISVENQLEVTLKSISELSTENSRKTSVIENMELTIQELKSSLNSHQLENSQKNVDMQKVEELKSLLERENVALNSSLNAEQLLRSEKEDLLYSIKLEKIDLIENCNEKERMLNELNLSMENLKKVEEINNKKLTLKEDEINILKMNILELNENIHNLKEQCKLSSDMISELENNKIENSTDHALKITAFDEKYRDLEHKFFDKEVIVKSLQDENHKHLEDIKTLEKQLDTIHAELLENINKLSGYEKVIKEKESLIETLQETSELFKNKALQMEVEIENSKKTASSLNEKLEHLQVSLNEKNSEKEVSLTELANISSEKDKLLKEKNVCEASFIQLKVKLAEVSESLNDASQLVTLKESEIDSLKSERLALKEKLVNLEAEQQELRVANCSVKEILDISTATHQESRDQLEASISNLKDTVKKLLFQEEDLKFKLNNANKNFADVEASSILLSSKLSFMENQYDTLKNENEVLVEKIEKFTANENKRKLQLEDNIKSLTLLERELAASKKEYESIYESSKLTASNADLQISDLRQSILTAEFNLKCQTQQLEAKNNEIKDITTELRTMENQRNEHLSSILRLEEDLAENINKNHYSQQQLSELSKKLSEVSVKKNSKKESEVQTVNRNDEELVFKTEKESDSLNDLRSKIFDLETQLKESALIVKKLEEDAVKFSGILKAKEICIQELQEKILHHPEMLDSKQSEIKNLRERCQKVELLEVLIEKKEDQSKKLNADIEELQTKLNQADQIIQSKVSLQKILENDINDGNYTIKELNKNVDILKGENSDMELKIQCLKDDLKEMKMKLTEMEKENKANSNEAKVFKENFDKISIELEEQKESQKKKNFLIECLKRDIHLKKSKKSNSISEDHHYLETSKSTDNTDFSQVIKDLDETKELLKVNDSEVTWVGAKVHSEQFEKKGNEVDERSCELDNLEQLKTCSVENNVHDLNVSPTRKIEKNNAEMQKNFSKSKTSESSAEKLDSFVDSMTTLTENLIEASDVRNIGFLEEKNLTLLNITTETETLVSSTKVSNDKNTPYSPKSSVRRMNTECEDSPNKKAKKSSNNLKVKENDKDIATRDNENNTADAENTSGVRDYIFQQSLKRPHRRNPRRKVKKVNNDNVDEEQCKIFDFSTFFGMASNLAPDSSTVVETTTDLTELTAGTPDYNTLEKKILDNLKARFDKDLIYTRIQPSTLLSLNPGKPTGQNNVRQQNFDLASLCNLQEMVKGLPHVFELAASAYLHMTRTNECQMIIANGETGAGKTEAIKLALQQLIFLSTVANDDQMSAVNNTCKQFNQVLESFGNAKTLFNVNSSRYTKYNEIQFNDDGQIVGTIVNTFHLETARVSGDFSSKGWEEERNFHIFYQLLAGCTDEEKTEWKLGNIETFSYLNHGKNSKIAGYDDKEKFIETRILLKAIGLTKSKQANIFQLLAAILHLGNIQFAAAENNKENSVYVQNREVLEFAAELLDVDPNDLNDAITTRSSLINDGLVSLMLDVSGSNKARNSLANLLYSLVFTWIVEHTNATLNSKDSQNFIGLLDLAGFDTRHTHPNYFYQFCADFTHHKIQQYHWATIQENLASFADTDIELVDNITKWANPEILELYEYPKTGIFAIANEFTKNLKDPESVVENLMLEEFKAKAKPEFLTPGPTGWSSFVIKHDNEKTTYSTATFIQSNRSTTWNPGFVTMFGLKKGISKTNNRFVVKLLAEVETEIIHHPRSKDVVLTIQHGGYFSRANSDKVLKRKLTINSAKADSPFRKNPSAMSPLSGAFREHYLEHSTTTLSQFKTSLDQFTSKLLSCRDWTIICLKVNHSQSPHPNSFIAPKLLHMLQTLKIAPLVKVSNSVKYTVTYSYDEFMGRYYTVFGFEKPLSGTAEELKAHLEVVFQRENVSEAMAKLTDDESVVISESYWKTLESSIDKKLSPHSRRINYVKDNRSRTSSALPKVATLRKVTPQIGQVSNDSQMELGAIETPKVKATEEVAPPPIKAQRNIKKSKKKEKKPKEVLSRQRYHWLNFTWGVTWWIPTCCLVRCGKMTDEGVQSAWREKVALNVIILIMSAVMWFFILGLGRLMCPTQVQFSLTDLKQHVNFETKDVLIAWNGEVFNVGSYISSHVSPGSTIMTLAGADASSWFPRIDPETNEMPSECNIAFSKRDFEKRAISTKNEYSNSTNARCSDKTKSKSEGYCHATAVDRKKIVEMKTIDIFLMGQLSFKMDDFYASKASSENWILWNNNFYNMTVVVKNRKLYNLIFPDEVINLMEEYSGGVDISTVKGVNDFFSPYKKCLDATFFMGVMDTRIDGEICNASAYILYGTTGILVFIMVVKFLAALQLGAKMSPEGHDKFVILQVPCYSENEDSLRKTIDSLSLFEYDDTRKLLFLICDGMVKGSGNLLSTPDICLKIFGIEDDVNPEPKSYIALGKGQKQHNKAKVYSGLYEVKDKCVPYILVVKCGTETEDKKPGNRGKRDSQMLLMKFLNKVHYQTPMTPLDMELYHHIKYVIGVDPFLYEYCLMVDADTEALPDSLNRLISKMVQDSKIMGICGETKIANERDSWVTAIQVYEYYISHHLAKAFESLFGSVTCLPGCFCMYRIRTAEEKLPLLIAPCIIENYEENNVNTLHKQNLLSLGEDRYLTTLMLKYFPTFRNKFTPDAICLTIVPDSFSVLLSQRRRWINSTVHNLFELIFLPELCGCLCFSMRMVIFLDMFATLIMPAAVAYLGYLIYASYMAQTAPIISIIMLAVAYGLQAIIFIIKGQFQHIGWMIISVLAMPVFSFYLPLYAYWHFDDFSWGDTRRVAGAVGGDDAHGMGKEEAAFDVKTVPLISWEEDGSGKKGARKILSDYASTSSDAGTAVFNEFPASPLSSKTQDTIPQTIKTKASNYEGPVSDLQPVTVDHHMEEKSDAPTNEKIVSDKASSKTAPSQHGSLHRTEISSKGGAKSAVSANRQPQTLPVPYSGYTPQAYIPAQNTLMMNPYSSNSMMMMQHNPYQQQIMGYDNFGRPIFANQGNHMGGMMNPGMMMGMNGNVMMGGNYGMGPGSGYNHQMPMNPGFMEYPEQFNRSNTSASAYSGISRRENNLTVNLKTTARSVAATPAVAQHQDQSANITDEEIREQISLIMASTSLEELTKKKVRTALEAHFGCNLMARKDIINDFIEHCIQNS
ncbi:hypothetical protein HDU92_008013 [Lobulomyces angularis]|nr:hypothetical protein HDU92_008013 [Lobulomyces angularis]